MQQAQCKPTPSKVKGMLLDIKSFFFLPLIMIAVAWSLYVILFEIMPFMSYLEAE